MKFRITNGRTWAVEADAARPVDLLAHMRRILRDRTATEGRGVAPFLDRLDEIDTWLTERIARPDATHSNRLGWQRQAASWRADARHRSGLNEALIIHVQSADGEWRSLAKHGHGQLTLTHDADLSALSLRAWESGEEVINHIRQLSGLAEFVAKSDAPATTENDAAAIHLRVPRMLKAAWVAQSRSEGLTLTDWILGRIKKS